MILREWHAVATPEGANRYAEYVRTRLVPELRRLVGFVGLDLAARDRPEGTELVVLTRWTSLEALARFATGDINRAVVHPDAQAMLIRFDEHVTHREVVVHAGVAARDDHEVG